MPPTTVNPSPDLPTLGDLLATLGDISADRVRYYPLPGSATEQDVIDIEAREDRLCELIDGVLVEKPMGYYESLLAVALAAALSNFVYPRKLGYVTGESGMMRLLPNRIRIPDVAYVSRARLPGGRLPPGPVPRLSPDIAVEVLSESNTRKEIEIKRAEYFASGTRLVWIVDPVARTVAAYSPDRAEQPQVLREGDTLTGDDVLPGFSLELSVLFSVLDS